MHILYNTSVQATIKCTAVASLEQQLIERDAYLDDIKAHLCKAQQRMKKHKDEKRRELEFEEGELSVF